MKPQKKAVIAHKAPKSPPVAKKRNKTLADKLSIDSKKDKKLKNIDNLKKSLESEDIKVEKLEKCKKIEEKRKKECKVDKMDDKKKLNKDIEKKCDMVEEKKNDKMNDGVVEFTLDVGGSGSGAVDKKKNIKSDDKVKIEKQLVDSSKKKIEKGDDKKKVDNKEDTLENDPSSNSSISEENNRGSEEKGDMQNLSMKKKGLKDDEKKKKDGKCVKSDLKESWKSTATKDKKLEMKKAMESTMGKKSKSVVVKKDVSPKNTPKKLLNTKKTIVVRKSNIQLAKKLVDKKSKLVKNAKEESSMSPDEDEKSPKVKKKSPPMGKNKINLEKKPKLAKQMKAKLPQKNGKINNILRKEKLKKITDKIVLKKKIEIKDDDKATHDSHKKFFKEDQQPVHTDNIKTEICNDKEDNEILQIKSLDSRKCSKVSPKPRVVTKKLTKKSTKSIKSNDNDCDKVLPKPEDTSISCPPRQTKSEERGVKSPLIPKRDTENPMKLDLKLETNNGDTSENQTSPSDSDNDYVDELEARRNRQKKKKKIEPDNCDENDGEDEGDRDEDSSNDERKRMRLLDFWNGPKRRVASLNALAKVHCMYENEAGGVYLGGYCKPKPEKDKPKKAPSTSTTAFNKDDKEESPTATRKDKDNKKSEVVGKSKSVNNVSKRNLRNVPGLRGKHWDMLESSSSSSSSTTSDEDESAIEQIIEKNVNKRGRKKNTTIKKKKNEEVMDLKDMVVCKRMASLNASAMLAASYSDEKNRNSSSSESSSDSEVEIMKRRKHQGDTEAERRKARQDEEAIKSSKKVVIVNQDTDVTITGVYVNQTRSTHHEGFCSIAGMQYRISSTSHTQTAATAVAAELHEQQKIEPPCKSYTPLGALSSMQPPGSQATCHPNMSPRRHSAFTAPHQHSYYQPAGPLIQHPPILPPIKGPPPEPTPTPPQNSEGSDDLVATSTTSGGTNSTGNSWRSYRKTESRIASSAIPPSTSIVPTGGGFYRAYCPQYYGTPPQYQELCYPPTYPHPHPPYYKYAPAYRRQYYGYPEAGGGGPPVAGGTGAGAPPGIVEYPPPLPPGEYPMPPYYGGYPPPPPPPPPPPNSAYLHPQGRPIVDHAAFQGCPCPMQSCPKNVDTGPLIGNGKGAPVASGPGLSLPPSALVGPPSPARGLAGLAPPHGANAWDTDRVQLNNHRNVNKNQQLPTSVAQHNNIVNEHCRSQINECRTKDEKTCADDTMSKCSCEKRVCASTCEVKLETLSPNDTRQQQPSPNLTTENLRELKLENNNVKCESCSVSINDNISCAANCNVKCETTDFKCEIIKCEQCIKEGQMAILEIDKESGILLIDDKLEAENGVKEEINDVAVVDSQNWIKPDYEATVTETIEENDKDKNGHTIIVDELAKCQRVGKRKLSLDSLSSSAKKRKVSKRTLSVGSSLENSDDDRVPNPMNGEYFNDQNEVNGDGELNLTRKKYQLKKENNKRKINDVNLSESNAKKSKSTTKHTITNGIINCLKSATTDTSIMETINDVIEQSVQMTNKKDINCKPEREKMKKQKKKTISLLSIIKKVPKTLVKVMVNEKLCISKNEMKNIKELKTYKNELKNNKIKILENNKCKNKVKAKIVEMKSKVFDSKAKVADIKMKEITKKIDITSKTKLNVDEKYGEIKKAALVKTKRKSTKKVSGKRSCGKIDDNIIVNENCSLAKKPFLKPKWSNGWSWEGEPYEAKVYLTNEECAIRRCYESMRHISGDVLRPRDCVLLKSGPRKADLPFVAKIAALWENPDDGEMMFSLLWYYRPEHTEQGRTDYDTEDEVFASRHRDANSVACIEDKCYILTFNEYCRYRKNLRRTEEGLDCPGLIVPPGGKSYPRESRQPPIPVPSDIVLFCRRVYDYRGKKLVKNPG